MKLLIISGSPREDSHSLALANVAIDYAKNLEQENLEVELLNLHENKMQRFEGFGEKYDEKTQRAISMLRGCDACIISTPVYNASYSGVVKNLFEHSNYKMLKGKIAGFILNAGGKISFENVRTQLNSLMNYFSIFSNPKTVYASPEHFKEGSVELKDDLIQDRIEELVDSTLKLAGNLKK